ncbi:PEP-CTERM/exosortase system-associated acyltransferase [Kineobactrum sediminis]|nr:PEP-CTERM/exosortase system-associated acyltransferase [Kineobactrum sediminis]
MKSAAAPLDALEKYFSLKAFEIGSSEGTLHDLYALRYQVYCLECEFLSAADYPSGLECDEVDHRSAHFAALNADNVVIGTARLVFPEPGEPFPYEAHCPPHSDFERPPVMEAVEVSRLAVSRQYRRRAGDTRDGVNAEALENGNDDTRFRNQRVNGPLLVLGLYREMYRFSRKNNIRYWYAAMERSLARVLAMYGFVFTAIGDEHDYYGPVTPYIGDLRKLEDQLRATSPELLEWFING